MFTLYRWSVASSTVDLQQHGCTRPATGCHHLLQCHQLIGQGQAVELGFTGSLQTAPLKQEHQPLVVSAVMGKAVAVIGTS